MGRVTEENNNKLVFIDIQCGLDTSTDVLKKKTFQTLLLFHLPNYNSHEVSLDQDLNLQQADF